MVLGGKCAAEEREMHGDVEGAGLVKRAALYLVSSSRQPFLKYRQDIENQRALLIFLSIMSILQFLHLTLVVIMPH